MNPLESQLLDLVRHAMTCLSTIVCVYLLGKAALPIVVRVLEFLEHPTPPPTN